MTVPADFGWGLGRASRAANRSRWSRVSGLAFELADELVYGAGFMQPGPRAGNGP
jgi:hypothetical protein